MEKDIVFHDRVSGEIKFKIKNVIDELNKRFENTDPGTIFVPEEMSYWDPLLKSNFVILGKLYLGRSLFREVIEARMIITYEDGECKFHSLEPVYTEYYPMY